MPFLYLPDAVSLALLLFVLSLLRRAASSQFQQEMHRLRTDLFECSAEANAFSTAAACRHLNSRIRSAIMCADEMTPAQLFFVARLLRKAPPSGYDCFLPEWFTGFESLRDAVSDHATRERLRKIEMEFGTTLGMYYLFGSLTGWITAAGVVCRLIRRAFAHRSKDRIDWVFDAMERFFIREGTRAHRMALASSNASREFRLESCRDGEPEGD